MSELRVYVTSVVWVALLTGMVFFGAKAYTHALLYETTTTEMVVLQGAQEQAKRQLEKFASSIFGTLVSDERQTTFEKIRTKRDAAKNAALENTRYFMYLLAGLLCLYFLLSPRMFTIVGSLAAMITLVYGLICPILMVTIHQEVEYIGDIVLSFESKGVIGSIVKLFDGGDVVVALVISVFSVLVPILKVFSLLIISLFMQNHVAHRLVKFFKIIGKWSMVDVFVVAVFLVYLTANKAEASRAEVEVGLYFFLAYVIISMFLSLTADKIWGEKSH